MRARERFRELYWKWQAEGHPLAIALAPLAAIRRIAIASRNSPVEIAISAVGRMLAEDPVVHLPEVGRSFALDARSDLFVRIVRDGRYEPETFDLLQSYLKPDSDFIDVGANVGFFSVWASTHLASGRVLAIEPSPAAFKRLQRNVENRSNGAEVILENCLVGERSGEAILHTVPGKEEYSSLGPIIHPSARRDPTVSIARPIEKLDTLVDRHGLRPTLVKLDVEGAEGLVLAGARRTLEAYRPVLFMEFSPSLLKGCGTDPGGLLRSLAELGYSLSDPGAPGLAAGVRRFGEVLAIPARMPSTS